MISRGFVSALQVGILALGLLWTASAARADDGWGPALGEAASPEGWVQVRDDDGGRGGGWAKPTPTPSPTYSRRRPVTPGPAPSAPQPSVTASPDFSKGSNGGIAKPPQQGVPIGSKPPVGGGDAPDVERPPAADSDPNPIPLPPVGDSDSNPYPLPPEPSGGVPAPKTPLAYDHLGSWDVSGGDTPAVRPTVPRSEPASPAEYLLALLEPRRAEPYLLNLALPRYSYFQGFVYAAGGAVIAGPVRVLGAVFAAGAGRTSWLMDGAMLTTTPDYLRGPGAAVRSRLEVVEWREVEVGK